MNEMISTLLDPSGKQETYEEFLSKFEYDVIPTTKPEQQEEEDDQKMINALKQLREASAAVTTIREEIPAMTTHEEKMNDGSNISELSNKTDSTISAGPGSTASILDNPELQKQVKFDNFVDGFSDSLHPSDISDAESFEWVHVAGKDESTKPATPPNTPALTDASLAKLCSQQEKKKTNTTLNKNRSKVAAAGPELPPAMKEQLAEEKKEADSRKCLTKFGNTGPALPPGWTVDVQTLKSRPPGGDSEVIEDSFTAEDAQQLHHELLTTNSNCITTDADTIVSEAELLRGSPSAAAVKSGNLVPASKYPLITSELFGSLNTPQRANGQQESAFVESKNITSSMDDKTETPQPSHQQQSETTDEDVVKVWSEDIETFQLDPDFDYDAIRTLKTKPRNPYEVGENGH